MSQRLQYSELSPGGVAALRGVEHFLNTGSCLEPVLLELVRLRTSLMNGCAYCVGLHTNELRKHHEPEGRIADVAQWPESQAYTRRERAALAWAERVTDLRQGQVPDEAFAAVREHFSDVEVVNLTLAVASANAWNRMATAFRVEQGDAGQDPIADDGGKVEVEE